MESKLVYLSLGSNIGDREKSLNDALESLAQQQIHIIARSSLYETEPQDVVDQPWFLNIVVACETRYFPLQLLQILQRCERELGRVRGNAIRRRGPRIIDIDILLYGNVTLDTPPLSIPHPRMLQRRFVLEPLLEIAPNLKFPGTNKPLKSYLSSVATQQTRKRTQPGKE
ncbi:MAG TPA: 2-amino-4-hydroxy-6-hydroxymethyldihydropteridine diphosphokinase [Bryobacteraceae bacterium]|nr:2-amino-4-hydroxy-6-hydroxymethyldihydropteridine diphosphokinase [Bryobacteraceae bacterium]